MAFNSMAETIRRMLRDMSDEGNKLTAMLDTMEDGVVVIAADGRITLMNSAGGDAVGYRGERCGGRAAGGGRA